MNLERALAALGAELEYPPTPELRARVIRRLDRRRERRRWFAVGFAVLAVAVGAAMAVPQARSAILEWLGIGGVSIERVATQPSGGRGAPPPGVRVSREEAREAVDFPLLGPDRAAAVYLDRSVPGGAVSFAWDDVLLTQFRGESLIYIEKMVGPGTTVDEVRVKGYFGYWLEGASHVVIFRDRNGESRAITRRRAGNVLLWELDGITLRLEVGRKSRAEALALADSLGFVKPS